ncbi:MAG: acetyl-CoA carboxylase carboxyltransferase subunit alpha [Pseudomonadota bacterium]
MKINHLDFEQPLVDLEEKIHDLNQMTKTSNVNLSEDVNTLKKKLIQLTSDVFSNLTPWQVTQVARHPKRPHTLDYIPHIFTDFQELFGDRAFGDDPAMIVGLGKLLGRCVVIMGQQKGRTVSEKVYRNFGMPKPEGYRKARRLMQLAERFNLPVITFIDTPGAFPGIDAEQRGQSLAIAENIYTMSQLKIPIISIVIGEGGSGGALAVGVCDYLMMLEYSIYSVISPEGFASILWKTSDKASDAAAVMGLTATQVKELGIADEIIPEPLGGAHRDPVELYTRLQLTLAHRLQEISALNTKERLIKRRQKYDDIGKSQWSDIPSTS